jgi:hypothetical protein
MHKNQSSIDAFKALLITDREAMEEKRQTMSDELFAIPYGVSSMTIVNYMWKKNTKWQYVSPTKISIDIEKTNELRKTYSDADIAKSLKCSMASIAKYCGRRWALWLPRITERKKIDKWEKYQSNSVAAINRRLEATKVVRKEDRWIYKIDKPYWDESNTVQLYNWAHPALYTKILS